MPPADLSQGAPFRLARRLARHLPIEGTSTIHLTGSSAEAIATAVEIARQSTGRAQIVTFQGAAHAAPSPPLLPFAAPRRPDCQQEAPAAIPYPGRDGATLDDAWQALDRLVRDPDRARDLAAVLVEPVQTSRALIVPPREFLRDLRRWCDRHGMLLIADEIHCGMGRSGRLCALEQFDATAEIVCLGKGFASGLSLGVTAVAHPRPSAPCRLEGATPASCAAALATLDLLEEGLLAHVEAAGAMLLEGLVDLSEHPLVENPRGLGLLAAIDVCDTATQAAVLRECARQGLLLMPAGARSIRLTPPLNVGRAEIDAALAVLAHCLEAAAHPLAA